jgi:hypothetical protein
MASRTRVIKQAFPGRMALPAVTSALALTPCGPVLGRACSLHRRLPTDVTSALRAVSTELTRRDEVADTVLAAMRNRRGTQMPPMPQAV